MTQASLNAQRFTDFATLATKPAAFAFDGPAYKGLSVSTLTAPQRDYCQSHLYVPKCPCLQLTLRVSVGKHTARRQLRTPSRSTACVFAAKLQAERPTQRHALTGH